MEGDELRAFAIDRVIDDRGDEVDQGQGQPDRPRGEHHEVRRHRVVLLPLGDVRRLRQRDGGRRLLLVSHHGHSLPLNGGYVSLKYPRYIVIRAIHRWVPTLKACQRAG